MLNVKDLWKLSSKWQLCVLFVTMLIASLDGIVLAQVISQVSTFTASSTLSDLWRFVLFAMLAYLLVLLAGQVDALVTNRLLKELHVRLKKTYLEKSLKLGNFKSDTDEVTSFMVNDYKLMESNYIQVLPEIIKYITMSVTSVLYLLYLNPGIALIFIACAALPMLPPVLFWKGSISIHWSGLRKMSNFWPC